MPRDNACNFKYGARDKIEQLYIAAGAPLDEAGMTLTKLTGSEREKAIAFTIREIEEKHVKPGLSSANSLKA